MQLLSVFLCGAARKSALQQEERVHEERLLRVEE
jgi:hypothetical protein